MPSELVLQPAAQLWPFLSPRRRRPSFAVDYDGQASLGHVIEAVGIPLTEVGALAVGGVAAAPVNRPVRGIVEIEPVHRPQRVPGASGFVLDVHLGALARRLRILGVDAAYRNDVDDDELVAWSVAERRILLTRDRRLLMRRALWVGAHVGGNRPAEQLADVLDRFDPPLAPHTRCTACNGLLDPVSKVEVLDELKPGTRRCYDHFARCRACGQVYWRGAHRRGVDAVLTAAYARLAGH